mmetsp:Transcript_145852/g.268929  ORF Transcript_145852/g.268929 Transcript_145852/m.268929 type:complete len:678 (+) Transcript_145852:68-2101(+)
MQRSALANCFVLFALLAAPADAGRTAVTPVQKVIEMLESMLAKGKEEKHVEEVAFSEKTAWCAGEEKEKTLSIKTASATIEQLTADIEKAQSDAAVLSSEIEETEAMLATTAAEAKKASDIRATTKADYMAEFADLSESIDAIKRAIKTLKAREADVPQSLLQVARSPAVDEHSRAVLQSFMAMSSANSDAAPEANAYEFQSGGVVDMLEKLLLKFEDQLTVLDKEELASKGKFQVLYQQLTDDMKTMKGVISKKTSAKASRLEEAATKKGNKKVTIASKTEDESSLSDSKAECSAYTAEYEQNQEVRADEIEALTKAIEILADTAVSGNAEKYLPGASALQTSSVALAHLRSAVQRGDRKEAVARISEFLQSRAEKVNSKYLALMATRVQADPFAKVKKMIKDLIVKLMEEANSEADQKAYCTTELATNKQVREDKSAEVDELTAKLDGKTAESGQLTSQIAEISEAMKALQAQRAEATKIRQADKATNAKTVADAKVAQEAVNKAIQVLREFYEPGEGSALLQDGVSLSQEMARATSDKPYKGMTADSGGIMGMLDVILSDFVRLETETTTSEDADATSYQKFMDESTEDLKVKETESTHLSNKNDETKADMRELTEMIESTQKELDAALTYYAKLKADCVDTGFSYELRKQKREEEIESLKEALAMLASEDVGF